MSACGVGNILTEENGDKIGMKEGDRIFYYNDKKKLVEPLWRDKKYAVR